MQMFSWMIDRSTLGLFALAFLMVVGHGAQLQAQEEATEEWRFVKYTEFLDPAEDADQLAAVDIELKMTPELEEWASQGVAIHPATGATFESNLSMAELVKSARDLVPTGISMASDTVREEEESLEEEFATKRALGSDNRARRSNTTAYPWRAIGWLKTSDGDCTGYQIGPRHVLTSAHCVVKNGKVKDSIRYYPGKNGNSSPYGYRNAFWIFVANGWLSRGWARYDYAVVILPQNNFNGWFGFWKYSFGSLKNKKHWNFGYPEDKKPYPSLWGMSCDITNVFTRVVLHKCDAEGGQSGSALYKYNDGSRSIVAIHKGDYSRWKNRAVRIESAVYSNLVYWKKTFSCSSGCCGFKPCEEWY